ncbi:MAG TPA: alpha/beta hydrolase [Phycisphaerae bacterium]|nr:alpha/beta hydrolase [Phycisphaerae bacterium]HRY71099.1 alpha/beta hydrolase [Phycisphaerae bacterium]HSA28016.1 alpha/beta hydrolase [Phycisphaerae bacterium]
MTCKRLSTIVPVVTWSLTGCIQPEVAPQEQLDRGYVILLPGVEGGAWHLTDTIRGLRDGGVDHAIQPVGWGRPLDVLTNLTDFPANKEWARRIAELTVHYRAEHPAPPITVVGFSGGGGLAVLAAEALPEHVKLDGLILVGAALSPDYDLSKPLAHVRGTLVNFYSELDWLPLGVGTAWFGTIDRKYTVSAGHVGFRTPDHRLLANDRVEQVAWRPDWIRLGHGGGHVGWLWRAWARETLAPCIRAAAESRLAAAG